MFIRNSDLRRSHALRAALDVRWFVAAVALGVVAAGCTSLPEQSRGTREVDPSDRPISGDAPDRGETFVFKDPPPYPTSPPTTANTTTTAPATTTTTAGTPPTTTPPSGNASHEIRIDDGTGGWESTGCDYFPADNIWNTAVDHLPGSSLDDFPQGLVSGVRSVPYDPLSLSAGFPALNPYGEILNPGKAINYVNSDDPLQQIVVDGSSWVRESEYTRPRFTLWAATGGLIDHRVPDGPPLMQLTSTDDHAYFTDTDRCVTYEHILWDRDPAIYSSDMVSVFDLDTNYRRISSRPDWALPPLNATATSPLESIYSWYPTTTPGLDGAKIGGSRGAVGATSGSGLSGTAGLARVEEVFESPTSGESEVDQESEINHAIAVVLPKFHISGMPTSTADLPGTTPFVWPATRTDGCGGGYSCSHLQGYGPGSTKHVPMGARLRLGSNACSDTWTQPQARMIVDAMCKYGVITIDSSDHFRIAAESSNKWSKAAKNELESLHLRDFELVDSDSLDSVDGNLWDAASSWATGLYGSNSALPPGWYEGHFWKRVISEPPTPQGAQPTDFAEVQTAVNHEDWLKAG